MSKRKSTVILTAEDFQLMTDAVRPGAYTVHVDLRGHDVWIWRARACRDGHCNLAGRFWHGQSKCFPDQTPLFERWLAGGAKGTFFPRD